MRALKLVQHIDNMADLPAVLTADPWASASEDQRRIAGFREGLLAPLAALVGQGASINRAAGLLAAQLHGGVADTRTRHLAACLHNDAR